MNVKRDGNGGYDINVQRKSLRFWGPVMAFVLFVGGGLGSKLGEQVWGLIIDREAINLRITGNSQFIEEIRDEIEETREDVAEIKDSQNELKILIQAHIARTEDSR